MSRRELLGGGVVQVAEYDCHAPRGGPGEPEQFTACAISLVRRGRFSVRSDHGAQALSAGSLLLGNPGQAYEVSHPHHGGDRCLIVRFGAQALEGVLQAGPHGRSRQPFTRTVLPPLAPFEVLARRLEWAAAHAAPLEVEALGLQLAAAVGQALGRFDQRAGPPPNRLARDRVELAMARLEAALVGGLRIEVLAREAGLSPFHFLRLFQRVAGCTPHQFLIQARLRRAVALLLDTGLPVTEVALAAGFEDLSHFNHTFRRALGHSPTTLRSMKTTG